MAVIAGVAVLAYLFARRDPGDRAFIPDDGAVTRSVAGEILVRFEPGTPAAARAVARRTARASFVKALPIDGIELLRVNATDRIAHAIRALRELPSVTFAEPNHLFRAAALPDDPRFRAQWGLHNRGQLIAGSSGTKDADIDAPAAWDLAVGRGVTVAVIDSGVAHDHPDVRARIAEGGWDFVDDDDDPYDPSGHGTHVAGIVAATSGDAFGVAGVAPAARILPLRVLNAAGVGSADDIASAIAMASSSGARIANVSMVGPASQTVLAAIDAAADLLLVAAAGNEASNVDVDPVYPCSYASTNVICVAASDNRDQLAPASNYGAATIDLAAPGEDVVSTAPSIRRVVSERFEGEGFAWNAEGSASWTIQRDNLGGFLEGVADGGVGTIGPESTTASAGRGCAITLTARTELVEGGSLAVEVERDGVWAPIGQFEGVSDGWHAARFDIPQGTTATRFHLHAAAGERVAIDDVEIACIAGRARAFAVRSGTSMAAPFVAGTAALLVSLEPGLRPQEIVARISGAVDRSDAFAGRVLSGGRLNASAALSD
ncbi:MAG: S8 family serine peptidase [Actinomycetota bacterium]|nr:S8 family serine peptidase [Actinomycetota bacterium]